MLPKQSVHAWRQAMQIQSRVGGRFANRHAPDSLPPSFPTDACGGQGMHVARGVHWSMAFATAVRPQYGFQTRRGLIKTWVLDKDRHAHAKPFDVMVKRLKRRTLSDGQPDAQAGGMKTPAKKTGLKTTRTMSVLCGSCPQQPLSAEGRCTWRGRASFDLDVALERACTLRLNERGVHSTLPQRKRYGAAAMTTAQRLILNKLLHNRIRNAWSAAASMQGMDAPPPRVPFLEGCLRRDGIRSRMLKRTAAAAESRSAINPNRWVP